MDVSDILSEFDFSILFSDILSELSFRSICVIRFIIYLLFLIIGILFVRKISLTENLFICFIIIFCIFCLFDLWIISSMHLYYSIINNGNELIMKDISAFSYYNPGNEFEFFYNSSSSVFWKGNPYFYYIFISFLRMLFIVYWLKNKNKSNSQTLIFYINTMFTFFLTGIIINLKNGTENVEMYSLYKTIFFVFVLGIVSVYEEYIFRDIIQSRLIKNGRFQAIILSSLLFTIVHFNYYLPLDILRTFILSIAFGMTYDKHGIKASITAHFSYNLAVYIMNSSYF